MDRTHRKAFDEFKERLKRRYGIDITDDSFHLLEGYDEREEYRRRRYNAQIEALSPSYGDIIGIPSGIDGSLVVFFVEVETLRRIGIVHAETSKWVPQGPWSRTVALYSTDLYVLRRSPRLLEWCFEKQTWKSVEKQEEDDG